MAKKLTSTNEIEIDAPVSKVWKALIDPSQIKEYLFGTNVKSDWKKGSSITYTGEYEGKKYTDKGEIVEIKPEELLHTTYLSGMSGKEDKPENYANVIYELTPKGKQTKLKLTQDNIDSAEQVKHMDENWGKVLAGMKKLLKKQM